MYGGTAGRVDSYHLDPSHHPVSFLRQLASIHQIASVNSNPKKLSLTQVHEVC